MIPFNKPAITGDEIIYLQKALASDKLSGDGNFTKKCHEWFGNQLKNVKNLLTPSCTHALEMAALLADINEGDEVILPSYTFVSTANAFVLRGAKLVFVDIRPDTMNIDENLIEQALTSKTRVIVPVHYAGIACEMDKISSIAKRHGLLVIEDAAQAFMSRYKGRLLGTIGDLSAFSFHETKNITSGGEGGLLTINSERFVKRAEIIREKGTNRSQFFRGMVDKYSWVDIGSSYLPSELQAAYLLAQLENLDSIYLARKYIWEFYYSKLLPLQNAEQLKLPIVPENCTQNHHMFYIKLKNLVQRSKMIDHLKENGIMAVFHYVPLHSSEAGRHYGRFAGEDKHTTTESETLLRLPLWYGLTNNDLEKITRSVVSFFH